MQKNHLVCEQNLSPKPQRLKKIAKTQSICKDNDKKKKTTKK
jgi:hypothetical protein